MNYNRNIIKCILFIFALLAFSQIFSQDVIFTEIPENYQLYPRDQQDSSHIVISGEIHYGNYSEISVEIYKDSVLINTVTDDVEYNDTISNFSISTKIHSELSEYSFKILLDTIFIEERYNIVSGDVYLINGQSNALSIDYDDKANYKSEWFRSFGNSTDNPNTCRNDTTWCLAQGKTYFAQGAVGVFGLCLGQLIVTNNEVPVCIISGPSAGSSIDYHFRNDSNPLDMETNFGRLLYRASKAKLENHIKAIIWNQGELDTGPSYSDYQTNFATLYEDWNLEYNNGLEKIYLIQIRPANTGGANDQMLREYQRQIAENYDDVEIISSCGLPGHDGLHYHFKGYKTMAEWTYLLVARDFYHSTDTLEIEPPNIKEAIYKNKQKEIQLIFENTSSLEWPDDTLGERMEDYFYCDGQTGMIKSGRANIDTVFLQLNGYNYFDNITYLPTRKYNENDQVFAGPWLKNSRGIGALSFGKFKITAHQSYLRISSPNGNQIYPPNTDLDIEWTSTNIEKAKLEFFYNDSIGWQTISENIDSSQKVFSWTTPDISSSNCKVRISDMNDSSIADESDHFFSILLKTIKVLSPNGGEVINADSTYKITWYTNYAKSFMLAYSIDNGENWKLIRRGYETDDYYFDWNVPDINSTECLIKIYDNNNRDIFDISDTSFIIISPSGTEEENNILPSDLYLSQNYPNPFNATTMISYQLPMNSDVGLEVFDIQGEKVETLVNEKQNAGSYQVLWNASQYSTGVYFYRIDAGGFQQVRKMLLIK